MSNERKIIVSSFNEQLDIEQILATSDLTSDVFVIFNYLTLMLDHAFNRAAVAPILGSSNTELINL